MMFSSRALVVALAAVASCGMAAAAPFASVPSVAAVGQPVTVAGGGFVPGAVITLRVTGPKQNTSMAAVVVADDGSISHSMVTPSGGTYRIQILDAAGRTLAGELRLVTSR
jgi:hypothetical protein